MFTYGGNLKQLYIYILLSQQDHLCRTYVLTYTYVCIYQCLITFYRIHNELHRMLAVISNVMVVNYTIFIYKESSSQT